MAKAQEADPDYSFWLPKKEVAKLLGVSTKTVEKFHADGKLQGVEWRRPSGGPKIMVYHPDSVEKLRAERFYTPPVAFVAPASTGESGMEIAKQSSALSSPQNMLALLSAVFTAGSQKLLEKSRKPEVPIGERVYLTVREAAAYLGWPEQQVRQIIAKGDLPARWEGHTRVRRRDLDKL